MSVTETGHDKSGTAANGTRGKNDEFKDVSRTESLANSEPKKNPKNIAESPDQLGVFSDQTNTDLQGPIYTSESRPGRKKTVVGTKVDNPQYVGLHCVTLGTAPARGSAMPISHTEFPPL
ncbi:hypothetical protein BZG36_05281 [Bifiguratus adelaidae]|uniref:Uncharacterized protein n=1 Tax=Bifiguratus adelaidae TaxID=1938954 RepID=A0A261XUS9_9FUNG|nr:hypothetical protein BZG36_05281 [Bifiguratus adelaidae]